MRCARGLALTLAAVSRGLGHPWCRRSCVPVRLDLPTSGRFNTSDQRGSTTQIITAEHPPFEGGPSGRARFLARFSGPTRLSYTGELAVFAAERGHLELSARSMEEGDWHPPRSVGACPPRRASTGSQ